MVMWQHTSGMPTLRTAWSCVFNQHSRRMLPHNHNGSLTFLVNVKLSNLNKEIENLPEDDLIGDRNMSECFKSFKWF